MSKTDMVIIDIGFTIIVLDRCQSLEEFTDRAGCFPSIEQPLAVYRECDSRVGDFLTPGVVSFSLGTTMRRWKEWKIPGEEFVGFIKHALKVDFSTSFAYFRIHIHNEKVVRRMVNKDIQELYE